MRAHGSCTSSCALPSSLVSLVPLHKSCHVALCWHCPLQVLAFIGEQLDGSDAESPVGGVVAGVGLSVRFNEDIISVWDRPCSDVVKERVLEAIRKHLQLPATYMVVSEQRRAQPQVKRLNKEVEISRRSTESKSGHVVFFIECCAELCTAHLIHKVSLRQPCIFAGIQTA